MNETLKLGLILLLIAGIAGCLLSVVNMVTEEPIEAAELYAKSSPEVANAVCPGSSKIESFDEELNKTIKTDNEKFVEVRKCKDDNGNVLGYGISTLSTVKGYGGDVEVIVGVSMDGKITGVKVTGHKETPGLGANIELPKFQSQFIGRSVDEQIVASKTASADNEIQCLGGATYSSKSFTSAVNNALDIYNKFLK